MPRRQLHATKIGECVGGVSGVGGDGGDLGSSCPGAQGGSWTGVLSRGMHTALQ